MQKPTTKTNLKWFIGIYVLSIAALALIAYGLKALLR